MGMDGLSMANTGMLREATSRDFAIQTEESVERNEENKQVDELQTQMKVKEDGHNSSQGKEEEEKKEDEEINDSFEESSENTESEKEDILKLSKDDLDNHTFYVKITEDGDIFELYDKESNRLVEKISANEINQLISKLNMASGILVNRAV